MTDPKAWPLWLQLIAFPPMMIGAVSMWTSLLKGRPWRQIQIACIIYLWLFAIFFGWNQPLLGFVLIAVGLVALAVFFYVRRQIDKVPTEDGP
jgi:hypothetical protein